VEKSMAALELVLDRRRICCVTKVEFTLEVMPGVMVDKYAKVVLVKEDTTVFWSVELRS
jgi:hypothetical protein